MNTTLTDELQQHLGYRFSDLDLLHLALTHSSTGARNYERLEHLGDAVLNLAVTDWLYRDFPHFGPGQMSILRAELVRATTLARFARRLDLPWMVRLSLQADGQGLRHRTTLLSDIFEAVLGAVVVDTGSLLPPVARITRELAAPLAYTVMQRDPGFYRVPVQKHRLHHP